MGCRVCFSPLHQKFLENRRESAVLVSAGTVEMGNIDGIDGSGGLKPTLVYRRGEKYSCFFMSVRFAKNSGLILYIVFYWYNMR
ncbi:hypothetical protein EZZ76_06185 [Neisseria meningitidis]|nr:hypothetical protein [Neisseria meningitidis]